MKDEGASTKDLIKPDIAFRELTTARDTGNKTASGLMFLATTARTDPQRNQISALSRALTGLPQNVAKGSCTLK